MKSALLESLFIFFIIGSGISLIIGIILFFRPDTLKQLNRFLNKWYSSRKALKPFEIMRKTDSYVFRRNKGVGWTMLVLSFFCLYLILTYLHVETFLKMYVASPQSKFVLEIALISLKWFFTIFIIIGIPIWWLLIFNPEKLRKVNNIFNRWISTRLMLLPLEKMYYQVDSFVLKNHKLFGILIILASALILLTFIPLVT